MNKMKRNSIQIKIPYGDKSEWTMFHWDKILRGIGNRKGLISAEIL